MKKSSQIEKKAINGGPSRLGKWITARHMVLAGYVTPIALAQTKLTYKRLRRLYEELESEGYVLKRKSRALRGSSSLISSHTSRIQASILMQLYISLREESTDCSINLQALTQAYGRYYVMRKELHGMTGAKWLPLDITDAWCLATEMHNEEAQIRKCSVCKCAYFTSRHQRTFLDCPFCRKLKPNRRKSTLE